MWRASLWVAALIFAGLISVSGVRANEKAEGVVADVQLASSGGGLIEIKAGGGNTAISVPASGVAITLNGQPATIGKIKRGQRIAATWKADGTKRVAVSLAATSDEPQGTPTTATIDSITVDAKSGTTLKLTIREKEAYPATATLAEKAPILVDGKPAKLADIAATTRCTVYLDGKPGMRTVTAIYVGKRPVAGGAKESAVKSDKGKDEPGRREPAAKSATAGKGAGAAKSVEKEIAATAPEASAISAADWKAVGSSETTPKRDDFENQPLAWLILTLRMPDEVTEAHAAEFKFKEEGLPSPNRIAEAFQPTRLTRLITPLQPSYIKSVTARVQGDTATGDIAVDMELYTAKIAYTAKKSGDKWKIVEFRLPAWKVKTTLGEDGNWKIAEIGEK